MTTQTVVVCSTQRPEGACQRRATGYGRPVYGYTAPVDAARLTARARRLVEAGFSAFNDGDDLSPRLVWRRMVRPIHEAARNDAERRKADAWASVYGCRGGVEVGEHTAPAMRAGDDATAYVNAIAETPGIGVRATLTAEPVWAGDEVPDRTDHAWAFMLRGRTL